VREGFVWIASARTRLLVTDARDAVWWFAIGIADFFLLPIDKFHQY
jgi:hypothetical protein